ncbi:asparaginase [Corynebacterium minutissimum]|uniref:asparaginase n=1 Tax=Corynebacterium minutissimum TaxID=38301 RepID=A0A2X4RBU7_9CORY|nr:asparaginase [Corynebacterium minutissimum]KHO29120.1 asparaginase [Corynebacterium minutissimum]QPS59271.1 asparaginase [Corynebacterium minutissimum]QQA79940.1 asparaginase [Corynebacterium minutissimum]SQH99451.1 L-asparaginase [Corynebacterium minutissimum]VEG06389.1 L-asparaginase [Corynebacterium minutissimum]
MTFALIATGGTIACTTIADGSLVPTVSGQQLADSLGNDIEVVEFRALDSSSITLADLDELLLCVRTQLARPEIKGVLITHGTDSMEETALALSLFDLGDGPIVLTGAQRAFDHPEGDGPRNLRDAFDLLCSGKPGVWVQFGGKTIPGRGARKWHTSHLNGFEELPVGDSALPALPLTAMAEYPVEIIAAYPGAGSMLVDASLGHTKGLVIEAMGSGNMGAEMGAGVARALQAGVPVVISTRTPYGVTKLAYGGAGGGATLGEMGAVASGGFRAGQARIMLAAALATGTPVADMFSSAPQATTYTAS